MKWQEMNFLQLCHTYNFTRNEANVLTILAKSQKFVNDEDVLNLLNLLGENALGVGQAILRVGNPDAKDKKLAEFFLKSQGFDKNGKRIKNNIQP